MDRLNAVLVFFLSDAEKVLHEKTRLRGDALDTNSVGVRHNEHDHWSARQLPAGARAHPPASAGSAHGLGPALQDDRPHQADLRERRHARSVPRLGAEHLQGCAGRVHILCCLRAHEEEAVRVRGSQTRALTFEKLILIPYE